MLTYADSNFTQVRVMKRLLVQRQAARAAASASPLSHSLAKEVRI
jgi:hypothetical protein